MKYNCDMISDLLPLYKDGICSESSRSVIEEHLAECPACSEMLNKMNDSLIDETMIKEKEDVINHQAKFFKRKSAVAGSIVGGVFTLPILISLIVDMANGSGLSWFFIVLAAMLIPAALIVVPLMVPKYKMLTTMCSFTLSVILLLGVCCVYTRGNWFFIAASAVLFGLTMCFAPFIACRRPVRDYLKNFKGLTIMGSYTVTFYLMITCIGLTLRTPGFFAKALAISLPLIIMAWIVFLIIRYVPANGLIKAGVITALLSLFAYASNNIVASIMLKASTDEVVIYSTPAITPFIVITGVGIIFLVIGIIVAMTKGGKTNA